MGVSVGHGRLEGVGEGWGDRFGEALSLVKCYADSEYGVTDDKLDGPWV